LTGEGRYDATDVGRRARAGVAQSRVHGPAGGGRPTSHADIQAHALHLLQHGMETCDGCMLLDGTMLPHRAAPEVRQWHGWRGV